MMPKRNMLVVPRTHLPAQLYFIRMQLIQDTQHGIAR